MSSNHLTCVLCLEKYNKKEQLPKSLPCLHTFCRRCFILFLQQNHASNQLPCPSCRKLFPRPENGVDDLPTNFMLYDLMEMSRPVNLMCSQHKDKAACVVCSDCQVGLCTVCITKLASSPHAHHKLADVESLVQAASQVCEDMDHIKADIDSVYQKKLEHLTKCATSANKSINNIATETIRKINNWKRKCLKKVESVEKNAHEDITAAYDDLCGKVVSSDTVMTRGLLQTSDIKQQKQELLELVDNFGNVSFDIGIGAELKLVENRDVLLVRCEQTVIHIASEEEKKLEAHQWKEKAESHLYIQVQVVLEDCFVGHQGYDLFDKSKFPFQMFQVKKTAKLPEFMELLSKKLNFTIHQLRPWPIRLRTNKTLRPTLIDMHFDVSKTMQELHVQLDGQCPWTVFVETVSPEHPLQTLPSFHKENDVLLFFKRYDPCSKMISFCGHHYMPIRDKLADIEPMLCQRGGFPLDTPLMLFEEVRPNLVEEIKNHGKPLERTLEELMDGDIIIFQRYNSDMEVDYDLPTAIHYFRNLHR